MPENHIFFFSEDVEFELVETEKHIKKILQMAEKENIKAKSLNFIFCSDPYLLDINKKYLSHNYYTDIITFDNSEEEGIISGDIFISVERAKENALEFEVNFEDEIRRLMIHGVLHLIGFKDGTAEEKLLMRTKEDYYLSLWLN